MPDAPDDVVTDGPPLTARHVVWAAGEAGYPRRSGFPGAELAQPTIEVRSWDEHPGHHVVIVGGYESGIDAAVNLVARGREVTVIDPSEPWQVVDADPSLTLSPSTHGRLQEALETDRLTLGTAHVAGIEPDGDGFRVTTAEGDAIASAGPPLPAIGFEGSFSLIRDRFRFDEHGRVELDEATDASTVTAGHYLAGPALAHREAIFCFIYRFRQRFALVARAISDALGVDTDPLEELREYRFYRDDLSCCADACVC